MQYFRFFDDFQKRFFFLGVNKFLINFLNFKVFCFDLILEEEEEEDFILFR